MARNPELKWPGPAPRGGGIDSGLRAGAAGTRHVETPSSNLKKQNLWENEKRINVFSFW